MRAKKAQIAGLDLILALMLFFMIIILFAVLWDLVQYNVRTSADADVIAIQVANRLLGSPGYPYDWNASNVELIGLSSERGVIDQSKLENLLELMSLDYEKVRELLGLGPYQLYINMTDIYGSPVIINGKPAEGGIPPTNATDVSSVRRTAIYGEIVVHNNSITFIFDSSGTMDWYSTSVNYTRSVLSNNSWINVMNATFGSSPTAFDFVIETSYADGSCAQNGNIRIVPPTGTNTTSNFSCPVGTQIAFPSTSWKAGVWKVYLQKTTAQNVTYDVMAETPLTRVAAAKIATNNFIDVISNESKGIDEMSLFTLSNKTNCPPGCPTRRCANLSARFTSGSYTNIKNAVNGITADLYTPLAQTLRRAADYTNQSATRSHTMIIMLSDGGEDCNGNVSDAATYAMSLSRIGKICTVGFAEGSIGEAQLKDVARIGGCNYYSARNETELEIALKQIYFGNLEKQKVLLNVVVWR